MQFTEKKWTFRGEQINKYKIPKNIPPKVHKANKWVSLARIQGKRSKIQKSIVFLCTQNEHLGLNFFEYYLQ